MGENQGGRGCAFGSDVGGKKASLHGAFFTDDCMIIPICGFKCSERTERRPFISGGVYV